MIKAVIKTAKTIKQTKYLFIASDFARWKERIPPAIKQIINKGISINNFETIVKLCVKAKPVIVKQTEKRPPITNAPKYFLSFFIIARTIPATSIGYQIIFMCSQLHSFTGKITPRILTTVSFGI